jgi:hypothetical protein
MNPYAPPGAAPPPPPGPTLDARGPIAWSTGDVMGLGWQGFKQHAVVLFFAFFLGGILSSIPSELPEILGAAEVMDRESVEFQIVNLLCAIIAIAVSTFFEAGYIRMAVTTATGGTPTFGQLFSGGDRFFPLLGANLLIGMAAGLGLMFCIVPGVLLMIGFAFAPYLVVEARMGPIQAMTESWRLAKGQWANIFVFGIAAIGVSLLGLVACCIGVYAAYAVISVAFAIAYLRVTGRLGDQRWAPPPPGQGFMPPPQNDQAPLF